MSEREVTQTCSLLDLLEPGESVMADNGFTVSELIEKHGASMNIPPFLEKKDQLSSQEMVMTRRRDCRRQVADGESEELQHFTLSSHNNVRYDRSIISCLCTVDPVSATPWSIGFLLYSFFIWSFVFLFGLFLKFCIW